MASESGLEAMMIMPLLARDPGAVTTAHLRESGQEVGMMYSRLERDPAAEMIRSQEKDHEAETTTLHSLVRDPGAEMMKIRDQEKGLAVMMMRHLDLVRGLEAAMIPSPIMNLNNLT